MNFISTFFRLTFITLLLGGMIFFGGREVWLFLAAEQVVTDARMVPKPTQWSSYLSGCAVSTITGLPPSEGLQLRFVDQEEYVLEVDCAAQEPVNRSRRQLPYGVQKSNGSAGFYYDFQSQGFSGEIQIDFLGRSRLIYVDGDEVRHVWGTTQYIAPRPASACQAFGYTCCEAVTQQGIGEPLGSGVLDCSQQCYTQCLDRPTLLAFQSDPTLEYEERRVDVTENGGQVIFSYSFDENASPIERVVIDYGDGTQDIYRTANGFGLEPKQYTCEAGRCVYTVTIRATDARGVESPLTRLSTITVEMNADL